MTSEQKQEYEINIDGNFIDDVLDGIEEFESKSKANESVQLSSNILKSELWDNITNKCKDNQKEFIESLVKRKTISMTETDKYGNTLLIIAAEYSSEIVQFCINSGCNIDAKNDKGETAMDRARFKGQYHIIQLLLLSKMNVSLQNEIKNTAENIQKQNGINDNIWNELEVIGTKKKEIFDESAMQITINMIKKRLPFCDNLLIYCWDIAVKKCGGLLSDLWTTISETCGQIIRNRSKTDWYWFKTCLLTSTIWYRRSPKDGTYLYYQLLKWVENEANSQLNKLEHALSNTTNENKNDWDDLITFNVQTEYNSNQIRQDVIPNGIVSSYSHSQLVDASYHTFNAAAFYDYNQYLSRLVLAAQMCDPQFQESVQHIFAQMIKNKSVQYKKGPVKLLERAKNKAGTDYIHQTYPTSSCVIDFNRCALIFDTVPTLLQALQLFIKAVHTNSAGTIIGIVRCKNGFVEYAKQACYADIKLNVIICGTYNIIGEVQFLLQQMKLFKDVAHNLYGVQRQQERMDNSVSKILPMLLDQDKSLAIAGTVGNIKSVLQLMVWYNSSGDEILKADGGGRNVLYRICRNNNVDLLLFLKSVLTKKQFFDGVLLECDIDSSCIETSVWFSRSQILKNVFNVPQIRAKYMKDEYMFRILDHMFVGNEKAAFIQYLLQELNITTKKVQEMMTYQFPPNKIKPLPAHQWDKYTIGTRVVSKNGKKSAVERLIKVIGVAVFVKNVFHANGSENLNMLECAIKYDRTTIIEYILSFEQVRQRYNTGAGAGAENDKLLFRLTCCLFGYAKPAMIKFILEKLKISDNTVQRLVDKYQYPTPKKKYKQDIPAREIHQEFQQYHLLNVIGKAVCSNSLDALQRLVEIIGDNTFNDVVFRKDGCNKNAVQYAVQKNKLDILMYMINRTAIKATIMNDVDAFYSIILQLNDNFNLEMAKYIVNELIISQKGMLDKLKTLSNGVDISSILSVVKATDK